MKTFKLLLLFVAVLLSCNRKHMQPPTVAISTNNNFTIFKTDSTDIHILYIIIDPAGKGGNVAQKFKTFSQNSILVGLNNVRNNQQNFIEIINETIKKVKEQEGLKDVKIVLVGFSGGARMAFAYSQTYPTDGLILCGASPNHLELLKLNIPTVMIIGTQDFNLLETYEVPLGPLRQSNKYIFLLYDGKHQWPDSGLMALAAKFLESKIISTTIKNDDILNLLKFITKKYPTEAEIILYELNNKLLDPLNHNLTIMSFSNFLNTPKVQKHLKLLNECFENEKKFNSHILNTFELESIQKLYSIIDSLRQEAQRNPNPYLADMNHRKLSYLGVLLYILCRQQIQNPRSYYIDKYLKVYSYLEPQNADMLFFKAIRKKQLGQSDSAKYYYHQALANGFNDTIMAQNFGLVK